MTGSIPQIEDTHGGFSKKIEMGQWSHYQRISTRGNPERIIWSSISLLTAEDISRELLIEFNPSKRENELSESMADIKAYLMQASEFYESAQASTVLTSPLQYYYSFLNLAKALIEIRKPGLKERDSFSHGMSRKTFGKGGLDKEGVVIKKQGILSELIAALIPRPFCKQEIHIKLSDVLSYFLDIDIEFNRVFGERDRLLAPLPNLCINPAHSHCWLSFEFSGSLERLAEIYEVVRSWPGQWKWTSATRLESRELMSMDTQDQHMKRCSEMLVECGLSFNITRDDDGKIFYHICLLNQANLGLPFPLPTIVLLFVVFFWFGSIVRYDPARLSLYRQQKDWFVLEGVLSQLPIILLEEFENALHTRSAITRPIV